VRIDKPVLGMLAALSLIVGGCVGTATASPSATFATRATASTPAVVATPTPVDPDALFSSAIAYGPAWKSFHLKLALGGSIKAAFFNTWSDGDFDTLKSDLAVDGTVIEGDMDPVNLACDLHMTVPALTGLTSSPTKGDLIVKNSVMYIQLPILGAKYEKDTLADFAGELGLPAAVPTPGGESLLGIANLVASLRQHMETNGVVPQVVGIEQIGAKSAYRIRLSVPLDKLNSDLTAAMTSAKADAALKFKVDSASAEMWIYQDTFQLAQVQLAGSSSTVGNLTFAMTLTNFDQPVTITAPPASSLSN
jgi:hypothetical protein